MLDDDGGDANYEPYAVNCELDTEAGSCEM